jgi:UrcA family protein
METKLNLRNFALLAGAMLLSTGAMAAPLSDSKVTKTETVKYSVPSSTTVEGAVALYQKLQEAAVRVCAESEASAYRFTSDSLDSCVSGALDKAVQDIGIPMVSALHLQSLAGSLKVTKAAPASKLARSVASR